MGKCGGWEYSRQLCWSDNLGFNNSSALKKELRVSVLCRFPVCVYMHECVRKSPTLFPQAQRETGRGVLGQRRFSLLKLDDVRVCVCV